ncbi:MAG TPA: hypothetical protein VKR31_06950, partial [Rhizomicrobium sp.]|nr:hypothetical protein [Rhizomicrobium sp.]
VLRLSPPAAAGTSYTWDEKDVQLRPFPAGVLADEPVRELFVLIGNLDQFLAPRLIRFGLC